MTTLRHQASPFSLSREMNRTWKQNIPILCGLTDLCHKSLKFRDICHGNHSRVRCKSFLVLNPAACNVRGQQNFQLIHRKKLGACGGFDVRRKRACMIVLLAGSGDENLINGGSFTKTNDDWEEARMKLTASLQVEELEIDILQALHEAARKFQLAMEQQGSLTKGRWFAKPWLGVDQNSWIKPLAYQAAVHALLQAVLDIASRGEGRDRDAHIFVQRSILRQCSPLEESINEQLQARGLDAEEWFWSQQHPNAVANLVDMLEKDVRFIAATSIGWEGASLKLSKANDVALLTLAINSIASLVKLGPAKLFCPRFFSISTEERGRLMDMLVQYVQIDQVYHLTSSVGLRQEFLNHFGPRAVNFRDDNEVGGGEGAFWVDLVQQLLRGAIGRERIRSKLTAYDSIEVLERDLAVFGFFAALGRRTGIFLAAKNIGDSDESLASLLRYLIGGCVLFYPQLASLNTYQLFIEVVCEEIDWLPFYTSVPSASAHMDGENSQSSQAFKLARNEAIFTALDNCSRWIGDFLKYSTWLEQPASVRATNFLLNSQARLHDCFKAYHLPVRQVPLKNLINNIATEHDRVQISYQEYDTKDESELIAATDDKKRSDEIDGQPESFEFPKRTNGRHAGIKGLQKMEEQLNLFDKELQGVDEALCRLESLSKKPPGKEHLTTACSNLERIRQLKKEVEILEASLREKASSMLQANNEPAIQGCETQKSNLTKSNIYWTSDPGGQQTRKKTQGLRQYLPFLSNKRTAPDHNGASNSVVTMEGDAFEQAANQALQEAAAVSNEIKRFELLRQELLELEMQIQECAGEIPIERGIMSQFTDREIGEDPYRTDEMVAEQSTGGGFLNKSIQKLKEASTDVWRGTQLLATDVAAAMILLQRSISGDEPTEREKKMLKRTLTDLASVIPIGFLMLLPVTAVGHAAILAAIQRYAPSLIPSAYARERLELLRQLEQVRKMESEVILDKKALQEPSRLVQTGVKSCE